MKIAFLAATLFIAGPLSAQVAVSPQVVMPASWERYAVRVVNQTDTPTVAVTVEVPSAIMVLGTEPKPGWTIETTQKPDSGPLIITWRGGSVKKGEFGEFPFLGRLKGDAAQNTLVLPVRIERQSGSTVEWGREPGQPYAAPRIDVVGTVRPSVSGAIMMAALSMGVALVALVVAIARKQPQR